MGALEIEDLAVHYGGAPVVEGFHLRVEDGELVSLLGPSGAGKTTVLRAVAGLNRIAAGSIRIDGAVVQHLPPERRDAVMVFQKPLLFPFLDVYDNVAFGLRMRGRLDREGRGRIAAILGLTGLAGLERRKVHRLSGGQQQRVSLARALVLQPAVLLLDEPLSNLDATLRRRMRNLILDLQAETGVTMLFVTHDQAEALTMSHRVALLMHGRLRQVGTPQQLFHQPRDPEVARFFGGENFFEGRFENGGFRTGFATLPLKARNPNGATLTATIRPEDVRIASSGEDGLAGRVLHLRFEGSTSRLTVTSDHGEWVVRTAETAFRPGQPVRLRLPADKVRVFPPWDEMP
jgi:ABC-type Fe3+/spermidine/putrescine transport system ATPase subunit